VKINSNYLCILKPFFLCSGKQIDWTATVDVDAFLDCMLGRPNGILSGSSAEESNVEAKDEVDQSTNARDATIEETGRELVDSNALRIPRKENLDAREVALGDVNLISRVINEACLVFPSAFRHFDAEFADEKCPTIVVTHDETDWQQALNAFDQVFTHFFGSGFLMNVDFSQASTESLLSLRLELLKKAKNCVPLALIFLIRLEIAAVFSFKDEFHSSHDPTTRIRKPLSQLLSSAAMLASSTQVNSSLGSFLSAFCMPSDSSIDIISLWLTPLNLLSYVERNNVNYDWVALDNAIGLSLGQVEAFIAAGEEVCIRSENTCTELKEPQNVEVQNAASDTHDSLSIHLKKKRKSRKRKVRDSGELPMFLRCSSLKCFLTFFREERKIFTARSIVSIR
jgi:hypothetical protein